MIDNKKLAMMLQEAKEGNQTQINLLRRYNQKFINSKTIERELKKGEVKANNRKVKAHDIRLSNRRKAAPARLIPLVEKYERNHIETDLNNQGRFISCQKIAGDRDLVRFLIDYHKNNFGLEPSELNYDNVSIPPNALSKDVWNGLHEAVKKDGLYFGIASTNKGKVVELLTSVGDRVVSYFIIGNANKGYSDLSWMGIENEVLFQTLRPMSQFTDCPKNLFGIPSNVFTKFVDQGGFRVRFPDIQIAEQDRVLIDDIERKMQIHDSIGSLSQGIGSWPGYHELTKTYYDIGHQIGYVNDEDIRAKCKKTLNEALEKGLKKD